MSSLRVKIGDFGAKGRLSRLAPPLFSGGTNLTASRTSGLSRRKREPLSMQVWVGACGLAHPNVNAAYIRPVAQSQR